MYLALFGVMAILVILSCISPKFKTRAVGIVFLLLLTGLVGFRYGVGSDYFSYEWLYSVADDTFHNTFADIGVNIEVGFRYAMTAGRILGLDSAGFIGAFGAITMIIVSVVLIKYSENLMFSVFLYFGVYYLIYNNSAIRQGMGMAIGVLAMVLYVENRKLVRYLVLVLLAMMFHTSAAILLLVPLFLWMKSLLIGDVRITMIVAVGCFLFGALVSASLIDFILINIFQEPYTSTEFSVLAVGMKFVNLLIVLSLYLFTQRRLSDQIKALVAIYVGGVLLYLCVCNNQILSRLVEYFMVLEVLIIPALVCELGHKNLKRIAVTAMLALTTVVFIKDIDSFFGQGNYYDDSILNYPYVSVFNQDDIDLYRER